MALTGRRRPTPPPAPLPSQQRPGATPSGVWLATGRAASVSGVVWLVRPMPDGQWPPEHDAPRDDSFSWWVRSACGHPGGFRQWAFYGERWARNYEAVFREDPCRYSRCPEYLSKIKNKEETR